MWSAWRSAVLPTESDMKRTNKVMRAYQCSQPPLSLTAFDAVKGRASRGYYSFHRKSGETCWDRSALHNIFRDVARPGLATLGPAHWSVSRPCRLACGFPCLCPCLCRARAAPCTTTTTATATAQEHAASKTAAILPAPATFNAFQCQATNMADGS